MSKTYRATDRDAATRKADTRRRAVIRAQKRHGVFTPPELVTDWSDALTDGHTSRMNSRRK